jgi:DNA-binding GntR family transcriptional regulator
MLSSAAKRERTNPSRGDKAYDEIKRRILENVWPPGFSAFEPQVAEELSMSRTPIREALLRLQNEGLIKVVPRRGMYVVPLSPTDMRDLYIVLASLEGTAAELLARRQTEANEMAALESSVVAMEKALARDDLDAWAQADERFHRLLLELCGNPRLAEMAFTVADQAHRARMVSLRLRPRPVHSTNEHRAVLEAIRAGNWRSAGRLMKQHRDKGREMILRVLKQFRLPQL